MNYYEHHIGDYAEATAHLSFIEDAAYSRLIRKYYATEKPLPIDQKAVQRLIGARTKEERDAVATILDEFFNLQEDGWHNARCDEEIARFQDKQAKAKRSAEARWNKQKPHTEGNANASPDAMRTHTEGNALQSPVTNHQTPVVNLKEETSSSEPESPPRENVTILPDPPTEPGHWLQWFNATQGLQLDPSSRFDRKGFWPLATRWCKAGVSIASMQSAIDKAITESREPIAFLPGYVDRVLTSQNAPPTPAATSTLAAARAIFGTEIEAQHHDDNQPTGRIIDITPTSSVDGDCPRLPRTAG